MTRRGKSPATPRKASRTPSPPPLHEKLGCGEAVLAGMQTPPEQAFCDFNTHLESAALVPLPLADIQPPPGLPPPPGLTLGRQQPLQLSCSAAFQEGVSAGSMEHPHACAAPCRYIKRKGGCREGASCPKCHLCFWQRGVERDQGSPSSPEVLGTADEQTSVGTMGHPVSCGNACKYMRRRGGCRDGADCPNCHLCMWRREKGKEPADIAAVAPASAAAELPPVGLFGESSHTLQSLIEALLVKQTGGASDISGEPRGSIVEW